MSDRNSVPIAGLVSNGDDWWPVAIEPDELPEGMTFLPATNVQVGASDPVTGALPVSFDVVAPHPLEFIYMNINLGS